MKDQKNPREQASLWSRLTFRWLNPLVAYGNKHPLTQSDLPPLGKTDKTDHLTLQLELHWLREQERAKRCFTKPSLWRALFGLTSLSEVIFLEFMFLMGSVSIISTPIMLYWLLETLTGGGSWRDALPFAVGISVMSYVRSVSWCHGLYRCSLLGMRVRTAITGIIYKKVLNLSQEDLSVITSGHVMNLISNDLNRFDRVMLFLPRSLTGPLEVVGLFACMIWIAGWPALIGICVSLLLITYQIIGSRQSAGIRLQGSRITDRRITLVREIINGIRTVKMHAWEKPSSDIVKRTRKAEVNKYRLMFTIEAIFSAFENATIATFTFVLVLVFAFRSQDSHASVPVIFSIMASFSSIRVSAQRILGYGLKKFQDCSVSERRIRDFLQSSDFFYNKNKKRRNALSRGTSKASSPGKGLFKEGKEIEDEENANSPVSRRFIEVKDLTISFQKHKGGRDVFCDVNLSVEENDIVAVIGAVGSGKTTLLSAILGQVSCTKGKIKSRGTICHVPQVPWIFNGSVRENITFGLPYDEEKYGRIIDACALRKDFELFSNGDLTVIGERGVALSGGQRARVSLARAVYADAEIYLIDDTLSALDVRVGKHVYGQCIMGLLKDRLRVLVTHQLQYLEGSGRVVIMEKGTSRENSYEEFVASNPDVKASLSGDESKEQKETAISPDAQPDEGASKGLLLHDEERDVGKVSWRTYWHYLRAGFPLPALLALAIFIVMTPVIDSVPGLLMSKWKHESWYDQHDRPGIVTYIIVSLVGITCRFLQPFLVYQAILTCTSALHNKMTDVIIKSPVLFFDRNPVGRILNRFSADTGYLDDIFPYAVGITVLIIDAIIALIIPAFANLWFALGSLPPLFFYIWYGKYYLPVSREVTRLQSLARTPVYAHYSSSMEGLTTISVHQAQDTFMNSLYEHQDELSQAWFVYLSTTRWLTFRYYIISSVFMTMVSICSVLLAATPGVTGFAIAYAIKMLGKTDFLIRNIAETENQMTSAQRLISYTNLPPEPSYDIDRHPPDRWPLSGIVEFRNVSLRYYEGGPQVLKEVNFRIGCHEKVGIAGRTGAGKTSIVSCLLRMPEATGDIMIDGVNIHHVTLQETRQAISVIQQNPVLFCRSIRENLDPFGMFSDAEIWNALHNSQLGTFVGNLNGKLDFQVKEGGANFSAGEMQLFCMARALLHKNKIIVMDEATANVDQNTDRLIQTTIREKFQDCTVLIIAHRLSTILDCDRIMVVDDGRVVEFDTPQNLTKKGDGWLSQLLQHS